MVSFFLTHNKIVLNKPQEIEHPVINMDFFFKHLNHLERRFRANPRLQNAAYIVKDHLMIHTFFTFNYSLIIEGEGYYTFRDKKHHIQGPCVITQWPSEEMNYGPYETWKELYFIYGVEDGQELQKRQTFDSELGFWQLNQPFHELESFQQFSKEISKEEPDVDKIDAYAQLLIMESRKALSKPKADDDKEIILKLAEELSQLDHDHPDNSEELAKRLGISESSFRRLWHRYIKVPPHQYRSQILLREARRLLVESDWSISTISKRCGYDDPLYFSRKFKKEVGQSPKSYRQEHQVFLHHH